ncbi:MAG: zinc ribbon-containing protein [Acinetobacter sp.]|nr:zinc ribbon-containing protein [Acinetobacter sp. ANC 4654]
MSKNTWRTKMVTAGSKPGTGFYFCVQCGHRTYLEIGTDRLPPCTKCQGNQFNNKNA